MLPRPGTSRRLSRYGGESSISMHISRRGSVIARRTLIARTRYHVGQVCVYEELERGAVSILPDL